MYLATFRPFSFEPARVFEPAEPARTPTLTRENPYPLPRVRVWWGKGTGSPELPKGYP
jgi:hypothetical protein